MGLTLTAILLGIVEGLTEFIPVSSTGHLILASELFGYDAAQWAMFNVVIQLGAILAVVVQYWKTLWDAGIGVLKLEAHGLRFARNIVLAFLPSGVLALILKDYIDVMLGTPEIVGWALIAGGIAILGIEKVARPGADVAVADLPLKQVIGVGFAQCLSMIPGVSRSGATIMGALAMGVGRKTARRADNDGRLDARTGRQLGPFAGGRRRRGLGRDSDRLCRLVRGRAGGNPRVRRLRQPARLCTVRLVSDRGRRRRGGVARPALIERT
jgi:undecaprenyl-diphosphatase UppP